jgi:cytochrome bd ubiquinol oxidase subunit II
MLEIIIAVLFISLLCYAILGGADLGSGIINWLSYKNKIDSQQSATLKAIKPVWEMNHLWPLISSIILFIIFPRAFYTLFTAFALPILFICLGLMVRAFALTSGNWAKFTTHPTIERLFEYASLWTSFWLGNLIGALIQGNLSDAPQTFYISFIGPWLGIFPILTGLFVCALYTYLAAIFLHTETKEHELLKFLKKQAIFANTVAIAIGGMIFIYAFKQTDGITFYFLQSPLSLSAFALATILLIPSYLLLQHNKKLVLRFIASMQMFLILLGLFGAQFPIITQTNLDQQVRLITFYNSLAPNTDIMFLFIMFIISTILIIPSLVYFYQVQKKKLKETRKNFS